MAARIVATFEICSGGFPLDLAEQGHGEWIRAWLIRPATLHRDSIDQYKPHHNKTFVLPLLIFESLHSHVFLRPLKTAPTNIGRLPQICKSTNNDRRVIEVSQKVFSI
jgi:hypothetical protein